MNKNTLVIVLLLSIFTACSNKEVKFDGVYELTNVINSEGKVIKYEDNRKIMFSDGFVFVTGNDIKGQHKAKYYKNENSQIEIIPLIESYHKDNEELYNYIFKNKKLILIDKDNYSYEFKKIK